MRQKTLGCLTPAGLAGMVVTLIVIAALGVLRGGVLFSPGKLSRLSKPGVTLGGVQSHADLAGKCSACHASPLSRDTMDVRCTDCHTNIGQQLTDASTLHGALYASGNGGLTCRACHTEHNGPDAALTVMSPQTFPHEVVGFSLRAHAQMTNGRAFTCSDCHGEDITTFDKAVCETCHRDLDAAFVQGHTLEFGHDCLACHDGVETYGRQFDHNQAAFPLEGKHAQSACASCHKGARRIDDFRSLGTECADCHLKDDAHDGQFGVNCAVCHTPATWDDATFDHNLTNFPLEGKHADVECESCHQNGQFKGLDTACAACHLKDDAHDGRFGTTCETCHTPAAWDQATFDHSLTNFPLEGKHTNLECRACHQADTFKGLDTACEACHLKDDAHDGQFGTECGACHTPAAWDQATFDHSKSGFPLDGAHARVDCKQCHTSGYQGTSSQCVSCHADPQFHAGAFGTDCASCHDTRAWTPARFTLSHPQPAVGEGGNGIRHGNTTCRTCHPSTVRQYTCLACHSNNQGGEGGGDD